MIIVGYIAMLLASLATGFVVKESCTMESPFLSTKPVWFNFPSKGGDDNGETV